MKRWLFFLYGVGSHLMFLLVYAYLAGFVGNFIVPKTIESDAGGSTTEAVVIDVLLIGLFAAQHSIMARPAFKRVWTRIVPEPIERSTYVFVANLTTIYLMWQWRGIDTVVWDVRQPMLRAGVWALFGVGWLLVPTVSLMIDHFDLFGSKQVWLYLRGRGYESSPFRVPYLYKYVRHPLYIGWAMAFWAIPTMTAGHLLLAGGMTVYMGLAAIVEERDLIAHFGQHYLRYRRQVPMFIPSLRSRIVTGSIEAPRGGLATDAEVEMNHVN